MDDTAIQKAIKQYQAQLRHSTNYYNKLKEAKKLEGTYRPVGRPPKLKINIPSFTTDHTPPPPAPHLR
jgi:hypothetical protein